MPWYYFFTECL